MGFSPIHLASANGHVEIVRELLNVKSELGLLNSSDGRTPLHFAATTGSIDVIRVLLLNCPESIRELTIWEETALHLDVKNNQFEAFRVMVEVLKQLNFELLLNFKDEEGNTVLYLATTRKQVQTIRLLLGGADVTCGMIDVNVTNKSGFTALDVLDVIDQSLYEPANTVIRELRQRAGAVRAQDNIISPAPALPVQVKSPTLMSWPRPWKFWEVLAKEVEDSRRETQNALIVVAALITSVTYQAILSPPGGFLSLKDTEHFTGVALMTADPVILIFILVMVLNSLGFFSSLTVIVLLMRRFPLKVLLELTMLSMAANYVCVVFYIAPTNTQTALAVTFAMAGVILLYSLHFMRWLMIKVWRKGGGPSEDGTQGDV